MIIRKYKSSDCRALSNLFYQTVHTVNAKDYISEQLDVWAKEKIDLSAWNESLLEHNTLVAVKDGVIVGFGDIDNTGYLDRLFVHKDYQHQGIGSALCDRLESGYEKIKTHASITAKPFFQRRGYNVLSEQQVVRDRVILTNYVMEKPGDHDL